MKRLLLLILLSLFSVQANAQAEEPDPLSFFPHHVGDTWVYLYSQSYTDSLFITEIQTDGTHTYIYYNYHGEPSYIIDGYGNVYYSPLQSDLKILEYKLTANQDDVWVVQKDTHSIGSSMCARVQNIYKGFVFGRYTTVKEIAYFLVPNPDTTITDNSAYVYTQFLASGFGFIRQLGESGDVPIDLIGCIINGDTLGTVTSVEEKSRDPFVQVFPNPCSSFVTIRCSLPMGITTLHINVMDVLGMTVHSCDIQTNNYTLNTSALPAGIYFCRVTAGTHTATQKIIVHR